MKKFNSAEFYHQHLPDDTEDLRKIISIVAVIDGSGKCEPFYLNADELRVLFNCRLVASRKRVGKAKGKD